MSRWRVAGSLGSLKNDHVAVGKPEILQRLLVVAQDGSIVLKETTLRSDHDFLATDLKGLPKSLLKFNASPRFLFCT